MIWSGRPASKIHAAIDEVAELHFPTLREIELAVEASPAGPSPEFSLTFPWAEIYTPTAAMFYQFSEVALNGRQCRVADFYQPPFTSR